MEQTKITKEYAGKGLRVLPVDKRDFSHSKVFGAASLADLPTGDFFVGDPLEIKNQDINYRSDFCASYAASAVSEDQEGIPLVPEFTNAHARRIIAEAKGNTPEAIAEAIAQFGLNLRDICLAATKSGFLERAYDPFACNTLDRPDRNYLSDWRNWPDNLNILAWDHAKASFFAVDGPYDLFDNIRSTMHLNLTERRSIVTGAMWRPSWNNAKGGFIDVDTYSTDEEGEGHAFKIFGQMSANGKLWLIAQMSDGTDFGDKGIMYFSREVVNKEFVFGAFTFKDMPKTVAQYHVDNGISVSDPQWKRAIKVVWNAILTFLKLK